MYSKGALALCLASAAAFVPTAPLRAAAPRSGRAAMRMGIDVESMPGVTKPMGFWDPLQLSKDATDEQLLWFRACELKHGRIAMLACTGFFVQNQYTFPGQLSSSAYFPAALEKVSYAKKELFPDVAFADLGKPVGAWDNIPTLGKWQIISIIFCLEVYSELQKPHYMKGGPMGSIPVLWDPFDIVVRKKIAKMTPEQKLVSLNKELNNGRLAMLGAMGFSAGALVPGSVPLIPEGVF